MSSTIALEQALHADYRFDVIAQAEGGFVIQFPDLPGCMTQVDDIAEVSTAAEEIRTLWLETAHDLGQSLPAPTYPGEFSGKFNVRIPKSLHRDLAFQAAEEGVSLNQFVVSILANRAIWSRVPDPAIESQAIRKSAVVSEEWRSITELRDVEVEIAEHRETALGKYESRPIRADRFGNETMITKNKIVPFVSSRRMRQAESDDDTIERAI